MSLNVALIELINIRCFYDKLSPQQILIMLYTNKTLRLIKCTRQSMHVGLSKLQAQTKPYRETGNYSKISTNGPFKRAKPHRKRILYSHFFEIVRTLVYFIDQGNPDNCWNSVQIVSVNSYNIHWTFIFSKISVTVNER